QLATTRLAPAAASVFLQPGVGNDETGAEIGEVLRGFGRTVQRKRLGFFQCRRRQSSGKLERAQEPFHDAIGLLAGENFRAWPRVQAIDSRHVCRAAALETVRAV